MLSLRFSQNWSKTSRVFLLFIDIQHRKLLNQTALSKLISHLWIILGLLLLQSSTLCRAEIRVTHASPAPLSGWSVRLDLGQAAFTNAWGSAAASLQDDGSVIFTPNWYGTALPAGGFNLVTVSIVGKPENVGELTGEFVANMMPVPKARLLANDSPGHLHLQWDRTASVFDIEFSSTLTVDDWTVVERVYGVSEQLLPINGEKGFYRIRPSY
jgi:hypothetical protein